MQPQPAGQFLLIGDSSSAARASILAGLGFSISVVGWETVAASQVRLADGVVAPVQVGLAGFCAAKASQLLALRGMPPLYFLAEGLGQAELELLAAVPQAMIIDASSSPLVWKSILQAGKARASARQSKSIFQAIYEQSPLGIEIYDAEGRLLDVNQACLDIFGVVDQDEIQGFRLFEDPNLAESYKHELARGLTVVYQSEFNFELVKAQDLYKTTRSGTIWIETIISPISESQRRINGYLVQLQEITERKTAEAALRESEEKYRILFQNEIFAVKIVDQETLRLLDVNSTFERLYGYTREELLGKLTLLDLTAEPEATQSALIAARREGTKLIPLRFHRKKDGAIFPVEVIAAPTTWRGRPVIFSIEQDISSRVVAEQKLRESERVRYEANERFRTLFEQTNDAVFFLSLEGWHLTANQRAADLFGYTLEEFKSLSFRELSAEPEHSQAVADRLLAGEKHATYERLFRRKDGQVFTAEVNVELVRDPEGKPLHFQSMVRDISQRKEAEEAIRRLLKEKELLMREVHHRIKNNMSTISGLLMIQADMLSEPSAVSALQDANSRVRSMMNIYDRLYRSESYNQLSTSEYLTLLLDDIAQTWHAPGMQVKLVHEIEDFSAETQVLFPLGIILSECITNAYKYAFPSRRAGTIRVCLRRVGDLLEASVADDGVGFSPEINLENPISFGLDLMKMLLIQLEGEMQVMHEKGTQFRFSIPL